MDVECMLGTIWYKYIQFLHWTTYCIHNAKEADEHYLQYFDHVEVK